MQTDPQVQTVATQIGLTLVHTDQQAPFDRRWEFEGKRLELWVAEGQVWIAKEAPPKDGYRRYHEPRPFGLGDIKQVREWLEAQN